MWSKLDVKDIDSKVLKRGYEEGDKLVIEASCLGLEPNMFPRSLIIVYVNEIRTATYVIDEIKRKDGDIVSVTYTLEPGEKINTRLLLF